MTQTAVEQQVRSATAAVRPDVGQFQTRGILTIVSGHFVHDTYTAFIAPLLPLLIQKLTLTLTQAGSLSVFLQIPALLNLFIGYLADRISVRYFVIFAPATTASLISIMGLAPTYFSLCVLLFIAGVSVAAFHAPAPAMIGQISGTRVGKGMSLFMAGGELGRTVGPLLIVWAVGEWGLVGVWRLALLGWVTSAILFWRLRDVSAQSSRKGSISLRTSLPQIRRLFLPLSGLMFLREFLVTSLSVYLVVLLEGRGYTLEAASLALALWSFAGVGGALVGGTLSDRIGRKRIMAAALGSAGILMLIFLKVSGWLVIPVLLLSGFTALSVTPVIQAMVLEQVPEHRATANGLFMVLAFLTRSFIALFIGLMGDSIGLEGAFVICAVISIAAAPVVVLLPDLKKQQPAPES